MKPRPIEKFYKSKEVELEKTKMEIKVYTSFTTMFVIFNIIFLVLTLINLDFILGIFLSFPPLVILAFMLLNKESKANNLDNLLEETYDRVSEYNNI